MLRKGDAYADHGVLMIRVISYNLSSIVTTNCDHLILVRTPSRRHRLPDEGAGWRVAGGYPGSGRGTISEGA